MSNTLSLASVHLQNVNGTDFANVSIHIDVQILSSAHIRRKVNGWLAMDVGDRMIAGEPELLIGERLLSSIQLPLRKLLKLIKMH